MKNLLLTLLFLIIADQQLVLKGAVENGNFETGNLTGWVTTNSADGSWIVYSGTPFTSAGIPVNNPPSEGVYGVLADQSNFSSMILYQDISVGQALPGHPEPVLNLKMAYENYFPDFGTPNSLDYTVPEVNQQLRIDLIKTNAAVDSMNPSDVLATVFHTVSGSPLSQSVTNVSLGLGSFVSSTVRLRFAVVVNRAPLVVTVDEVFLDNESPNSFPVVNITSPTNNAPFVAPAVVTLTANASDSDGEVTKVEFLVDGNVIGTVTNAPYQITNTFPAGTYTVTARATDNEGGQSISPPITVRSMVVPSVTQQPQSQGASFGNTVVFSVSASGSSPLTYQWRKNGLNLANEGNVSGANSPTLTLVNAAGADAGTYSVVVGNDVGTDTSAGAALSVVDPLIITQPEGLSKEAGTSASFTVQIQGSLPIGYRWQHDGVDLIEGGNVSGAGTATLQISNLNGFDRGDYSVIVTNAFGSVESERVELNVIDPFIHGQPANLTVGAGSNAVFSVQASGAGLTYQWRQNGIPLANGGHVSGANSPTLSLAGVTQAEAQTYSVFVSGFFGALTSSNVALTVIDPPFITGQPVALTKDQGDAATFSVGVNGTAPFEYQWFFGGEPIAGATQAAYEIASAQMAQAGGYTVVVSNFAGSATSSVAQLTIVPDAIAPTVKILTPKANSSVSSGTITIGGTAKDATRVKSVSYSLNGAPFVPAGISFGVSFTNWSATVNLVPGTNTLSVMATDLAGNTAAATVRFYYAVPGLFTLNINGEGAIIPTTSSIGTPTNGATLLVGRTYKLTAKVVGTNSIFTNWTSGGGSVLQTNNMIFSFTMQSNMVVNANFIPNPLNQFGGIYNGLFYEEAGVAHRSAGFFTVKVTSKFGYSGKLMLNGDAISFSGKLRIDGTADKLVSRAKFGKSPLDLSFLVDLTGGNSITGVLSDGQSWTSSILADRWVWNEASPATSYENLYTAVFPGFSDNSEGPVGWGSANITVTPNGKVKIAGQMGDGQKIKQLTTISKDGAWPFFSSLYFTKDQVVTNANLVVKTNKEFQGSLMGWLTFSQNVPAATTNLAPQGNLSWIKTRWTNTTYVAGFTNQFDAISSRWVGPLAEATIPPIAVTNALVTVSEGNLQNSFDVGVLVTPEKMVTASLTNNFKIAMIKRSGVIKGTFAHPSAPLPVTKWIGVLLQDYNVGYGCFMGPTLSGSVYLRAESEPE